MHHVGMATAEHNVRSDCEHLFSSRQPIVTRPAMVPFTDVHPSFSFFALKESTGAALHQVCSGLRIVLSNLCLGPRMQAVSGGTSFTVNGCPTAITVVTSQIAY